MWQPQILLGSYFYAGNNANPSNYCQDFVHNFTYLLGPIPAPDQTHKLDKKRKLRQRSRKTSIKGKERKTYCLQPEVDPKILLPLNYERKITYFPAITLTKTCQAKLWSERVDIQSLNGRTSNSGAVKLREFGHNLRGIPTGYNQKLSEVVYKVIQKGFGLLAQ